MDGQFLIGFNDWANIQFSFRGSVDFADGGHITSGETALTTTGQGAPAGASPDITLETAASLSSDATPINVDLKPDDSKNTVNRGSNQNLAVAFFSSPGFDATTISPGSVFLQGQGWTVPVRPNNEVPIAA